jgi:hypothetical protein
VRTATDTAANQVRELVARPENAVLGRSARRLAAELGTAVPVSLAAKVVGEPEAVTRWSTPTRFLVWLAGPYEFKDDWLFLGRQSSLVTAAMQSLRETWDDGLIERDAAMTILTQAGIRDDACEAWLARFGRVPTLRQLLRRLARDTGRQGRARPSDRRQTSDSKRDSRRHRYRE